VLGLERSLEDSSRFFKQNKLERKKIKMYVQVEEVIKKWEQLL